MSVHVFLGPSLAPSSAQRVLPGAIYHPPAALGDIYRVARDGDCHTVALVDGVFQQVPAVWHKEILFALERGIHVAGASSMGALRAAELDVFGMVGVGTVYGWYASGLLEDDDEVALVHGPKELDYPPLSVPMVNVRWSLDKAHEAGWLGDEERELVVAVAKRIHFRERTWERLGKRAAEAGVARSVMTRLATESRNPGNDVKREDAMQLLRYIQSGRFGDTSHHSGRAAIWSDFTLARTSFWERFSAAAGEAIPGGEADEAVSAKDIRRYVMLTREDGTEIMYKAMLDMLAERETLRRGELPSRSDMQAAVDDLRRAKGLHAAEDLRCWLARHRKTKRDFAALARNRLLLERVAETAGAAIDVKFAEELERQGRLDQARQEVAEKRRFLRERGLANPTFADCGLDETQFHAWSRERFRALSEWPSTGLKGIFGFKSEREFLVEALSQYLWEGSTSASRLRSDE